MVSPQGNIGQQQQKEKRQSDLKDKIGLQAVNACAQLLIERRQQGIEHLAVANIDGLRELVEKVLWRHRKFPADNVGIDQADCQRTRFANLGRKRFQSFCNGRRMTGHLLQIQPECPEGVPEQNAVHGKFDPVRIGQFLLDQNAGALRTHLAEPFEHLRQALDHRFSQIVGVNFTVQTEPAGIGHGNLKAQHPVDQLAMRLQRFGSLHPHYACTQGKPVAFDCLPFGTAFQQHGMAHFNFVGRLKGGIHFDLPVLQFLQHGGAAAEECR